MGPTTGGDRSVNATAGASEEARTPPALRSGAASGVRWGGFDQAVQAVVRLAAAVVLTRLVDPSAFGVMSLAMVVVTFAGLVVGLGFSQAVVQRKDLRAVHVSTAFVVSTLTGLVLTAAICLSAGPLAAGFGQPRLRPVLLALSAVVALQGLERTPNDLLVRALSFRAFYISSTISAIVGAAVGLATAAGHAGVWALVAMTVSESAVATSLGWVFAIRAGVWSPASDSLRFSGQALRDLWGFSSFVVGQTAVAFANDNGDNLLVGGVLGATALGWYSLAYRIVLLTIQRLARVIDNAAFPALARVQDDRARLQNGFLQASRYVALTCMPIVIGVAVTAPTLVPVVFGGRWRPATTCFELLALSGPALLMNVLSRTLYQAVGKPQLGLLRTGVAAALYLPAFVVGTKFGIDGVAGGYTVASYLLLPLDLKLCSGALDLPTGRLVENVAPVVAATLVMAGTTFGIGAALSGLGGGLRLGIMVMGGALAYTVVGWVLFRETLLQAARDFGGRRSGAF